MSRLEQQRQEELAAISALRYDEEDVLEHLLSRDKRTHIRPFHVRASPIYQFIVIQFMYYIMTKLHYIEMLFKYYKIVLKYIFNVLRSKIQMKWINLDKIGTNEKFKKNHLMLKIKTIDEGISYILINIFFLC